MLDCSIVTDGAAGFAEDSGAGLPLHIVPWRTVDERSSAALSAARSAAYDSPTRRPVPSTIVPPGPEEYYRVFRAAKSEASAVVCITASAALSDSFVNARTAAMSAGPQDITVIDSRTICAGQGLVVMRALKRAQACRTIDQLVRDIRNTTTRVFSIYYVESTETLLHNGIIPAEHSVLSSMLGVRPLLTLDDGHLVTTGKARTRAQIIDQLIEFAQGFSAFESAVIVQPEGVHRSEVTRQLLARWHGEIPGQTPSLSSCTTAMASFLGPHAGGLVILGSRIGEAHDILED
ncbi:MAG: DegV family EDD domain-containing protein [Chloroflexi bacterium]|nr:DegV family EDD domain-containing protein [Chloroflexota bacterium]